MSEEFDTDETGDDFILVLRFKGTDADYKIKSKATVGRGDATISIKTDDMLSRIHFEVFKDKNMFLIRDLGSKNGTLVNQQPLTPNHVKKLNHLDIIHAGNREILVLIESAAKERETKLTEIVRPPQDLEDFEVSLKERVISFWKREIGKIDLFLKFLVFKYPSPTKILRLHYFITVITIFTASIIQHTLAYSKISPRPDLVEVYIISSVYYMFVSLFLLFSHFSGAEECDYRLKKNTEDIEIKKKQLADTTAFIEAINQRLEQDKEKNEHKDNTALKRKAVKSVNLIKESIEKMSKAQKKWPKVQGIYTFFSFVIFPLFAFWIGQHHKFFDIIKFKCNLRDKNACYFLSQTISAKSLKKYQVNSCLDNNIHSCLKTTDEEGIKKFWNENCPSSKKDCFFITLHRSQESFQKNCEDGNTYHCRMFGLFQNEYLNNFDLATEYFKKGCLSNDAFSCYLASVNISTYNKDKSTVKVLAQKACSLGLKKSCQ